MVRKYPQPSARLKYRSIGVPPWEEKKNMSAANFAGFVIEDLPDFQAMKDSHRDEQLKEYLAEGFLVLTAESATDRYYMITSRGIAAVRGTI